MDTGSTLTQGKKKKKKNKIKSQSVNEWVSSCLWDENGMERHVYVDNRIQANGKLGYWSSSAQLSSVQFVRFYLWRLEWRRMNRIPCHSPRWDSSDERRSFRLAEFVVVSRNIRLASPIKQQREKETRDVVVVIIIDPLHRMTWSSEEGQHSQQKQGKEEEEKKVRVARIRCHGGGWHTRVSCQSVRKGKLIAHPSTRSGKVRQGNARQFEFDRKWKIKMKRGDHLVLCIPDRWKQLGEQSKDFVLRKPKRLPLCDETTSYEGAGVRVKLCFAEGIIQWCRFHSHFHFRSHRYQRWLIQQLGGGSLEWPCEELRRRNDHCHCRPPSGMQPSAKRHELGVGQRRKRLGSLHRLLSPQRGNVKTLRSTLEEDLKTISRIQV